MEHANNLLPFNDEPDCIKCGRSFAVTVIWEGISMNKLLDLMSESQKIIIIIIIPVSPHTLWRSFLSLPPWGEKIICSLLFRKTASVFQEHFRSMTSFKKLYKQPFFPFFEGQSGRSDGSETDHPPTSTGKLQVSGDMQQVSCQTDNLFNPQIESALHFQKDFFYFFPQMALWGQAEATGRGSMRP